VIPSIGFGVHIYIFICKDDEVRCEVMKFRAHCPAHGIFVSVLFSVAKNCNAAGTVGAGNEYSRRA
jgi:hypothetical protein